MAKLPLDQMATQLEDIANDITGKPVTVNMWLGTLLDIPE